MYEHESWVQSASVEVGSGCCNRLSWTMKTNSARAMGFGLAVDALMLEEMSLRGKSAATVRLLIRLTRDIW